MQISGAPLPPLLCNALVLLQLESAFMLVVAFPCICIDCSNFVFGVSVPGLLGDLLRGWIMQTALG
jgi:hypothetical protein